MAIEPDLFLSSSRVDQPICDQLNGIFIEAVERRVSDIHFQESGNQCHVRFRMPGGTVWHRSSHDFETARMFDNKIRSRAKLSFSEREAPLDGRMSFRINNEGVDVRVALTPGVSGQMIVCRMLLQSNGRKNLNDIAMSSQVRLALSRVLKEPDGMLIVTGPTGSGKSTLLYSILNELNDGERNIVTIEDPVEYRVPQFHQMPVSRNLSFADGLRAALRLDPDIIMVGEIRDAETAAVAIQASNTGHLVLSTMHANSAAEAIGRFVSLGVDPVTLGATLRAISAQRLLQQVTPDCPRKPPTQLQKIWLEKHGIYPDFGTEYPFPQGKQHFDGYTPVIELMLSDSFVQPFITHGTREIMNAASKQPQYETLAMGGERMAAQGLVSLEKVIQVTSSFNAMKINTKRLGELAVARGILSRNEMWSLIDQQAQDVLMGNDAVHIGQILVRRGLCTPEEVVSMAGYTIDAREIIERLVKSDRDRHVFFQASKTWIPGEQSLFDLAVSEGLCESRSINELFCI